MHITVELREVFCGTELHITQEGVPAIIPTPACYMGWQCSASGTHGQPGESGA